MIKYIENMHTVIAHEKTSRYIFNVALGCVVGSMMERMIFALAFNKQRTCIKYSLDRSPTIEQILENFCLSTFIQYHITHLDVISNLISLAFHTL